MKGSMDWIYWRTELQTVAYCTLCPISKVIYLWSDSFCFTAGRWNLL